MRACVCIYVYSRITRERLGQFNQTWYTCGERKEEGDYIHEVLDKPPLLPSHPLKAEFGRVQDRERGRGKKEDDKSPSNAGYSGSHNIIYVILSHNIFKYVFKLLQR